MLRAFCASVKPLRSLFAVRKLTKHLTGRTKDPACSGNSGAYEHFSIGSGVKKSHTLRSIDGEHPAKRHINPALRLDLTL